MCALTLIGRCRAAGCWASLKEVCDKIGVLEKAMLVHGQAG